MFQIKSLTIGLAAAFSAVATLSAAETQPPNILVIMADDVGWASLGSYHQGVKSIQTPNLDQLAAEGARLTDYYAQPSCTAGRSAFITGQAIPSGSAMRIRRSPTS